MKEKGCQIDQNYSRTIEFFSFTFAILFQKA